MRPAAWIVCTAGLAAAPAACAAPPLPAEAPAATVVETPAGPPAAVAMPECGGVLVQGGLVICKTMPGARLVFGDIVLTADANGTAQFGLAQAAPLALEISGDGFVLSLAVAPRSDTYREIKGFDCDKIDARTPEQKAHAARSWDIKQAAFADIKAGAGAAAGFVRPAAAPPSSPFGPTRKYIGVSKVTGEPCESMSVHQGFDMAAPPGTDVFAPAAGVVTLAEPDLYYEGGAVFLDHGHGLLSVFMHLSEVNVAAGDEVAKGSLLAKTGNTGRSTGPHLHWGVKWRNPASDDRRADYYIDPALLLDLPGSD